jgi:type I restriction enzyme M protein
VQHYSLLHVTFKDKEFTHEQAAKTLVIDKRIISVILSEIRKAGWLKIKLDPDDARKRLYILKSPEEVVKEIARGEKNG